MKSVQLVDQIYQAVAASKEGYPEAVVVAALANVGIHEKTIAGLIDAMVQTGMIRRRGYYLEVCYRLPETN